MTVAQERTAPAGATAGSDRLVHSSLHIMLATVLTGGLGYLFWAVAARTWDATHVGAANAALALCTALSLLVHLGPAALTIERLPAHEGTPGWGARLWTAVLGSAAGSAALAAAVLLAGRGTAFLRPLASPVGAAAFVVGCAAWSAMTVVNHVFVALRRSEQMSIQNTAISVLKLVLLLAFVPSAATASVPVMVAWSASALLGTAFALLWQLPRTGHHPGRPRLVRPHAGGVRSVIGHHGTSVGGVLTPFLLPPLVALLISPAQNAYFSVAWMVGSLFFMVAPAVGGALFAEGVRGADLAAATRRAVRLIALLLAPPMLVMLVGGRLVLSVVGSGYARHGYVLLVVLVASAIPDAVTDVAVGVYRTTGRLGRSATLNLGMSAVAVLGTVVLAPRAGIVGVGVAWGGAQLLGALWSGPDVLRTVRSS